MDPNGLAENLNQIKIGCRTPIKKTRKKKKKNKINPRSLGDINILCDDVLEHIFRYLDYKDLTKVEKVCRRWKNVCRNIWEEKTHLNFTSETNFKTYREQLFSYGYKLTSLSFSTNTGKSKRGRHKTARKILSPISLYCSNLTDLELVGLPAASTMNFYLDHCTFIPKLTRLCVTYTTVSDESLNVILKRATRLKTLNLSQSNIFDGHCLMNLSPTCTTLSIIGCALAQNILEKVFERLPNLECVEASMCQSMSVNFLRNNVRVTVLHLENTRCFNGFCEKYQYLYWSSLKNLELYGNSYISDMVLNAISRICPNLEELDLSYCYHSSKELGLGITSLGISKLVRLARLKHLKLNGLPKLDFDEVALFADVNFSHLKWLECRRSGIHTMTPKGLSSMINICPNLRLLDFRYNDYVSIDFLKGTCSSVKKRKKGVGLRIGLSNTSLDILSVEKLLEERVIYILMYDGEKTKVY